MQHSTFRQPLPDNLKPLMSDGYNKASQPAKSFEFVQAWPAGSLSTTAEDMSHYMIAHLQDGEYNGAQHSEARDRAADALARLSAWIPELNGMAYGFYEESRNGHRIIGHGGDSQWFHSDMHLMPDDHLGFFISLQQRGKAAASPRARRYGSISSTAISRTRLRPRDSWPPPGQDAKSVAGTYWLSRRSQTNVAAIVSAFAQAKVTVNADGTISLIQAKDFAGNPKRLQEIAPTALPRRQRAGRIWPSSRLCGTANRCHRSAYLCVPARSRLRRSQLNLVILTVIIFASQCSF